MLSAYSTNQTILTSGVVPFNSVSVQKGNTVVLNGVSTIQFNKCGAYSVSLTVSGLPSAAGNVTVNLVKDGVTQGQSTINIPTVVTTNGVSGTLNTIVQVPEDNSCCCCSVPTTIQFINSGVGLTSANSEIVITKIC